MKNFILLRIIKLASIFGVCFNLIFEPTLVLLSITSPSYLIWFVIAFFVLPFVLIKPKSSNNNFGFHVQRGMFIMVNEIYKRGSMMNFYLVMLSLTYLINIYILIYLFKFGLVIFILIYCFKIFIYAMCYIDSKSYGAYEDFDNKLSS